MKSRHFRSFILNYANELKLYEQRHRPILVDTTVRAMIRLVVLYMNILNGIKKDRRNKTLMSIA